MKKHFKKFRKNTIGNNLKIKTPYGKKDLVYADWIASGRLYAPIEKQMSEVFGPWVANTHTETSETGTLMTKSYHWAQKLIKKHVNASPNDVIITAGSGMTSVVNKLQRIMGLKGCGLMTGAECLEKRIKPVIFISHMEHHSNQTSWYETNTEVVVIPPDKDLLIDLNALHEQLKKYKDRPFKIGSFTSCSNVTGVMPPIHKLAKIMHEHSGVCFVDYAASAPYVDINMHPEDPMEKLDAVFFSPHKFLGGPGTSGVLIFDSSLYHSKTPDDPGGGTVDWTNAWGEYKYIDDIEAREDGGTPGFLQSPDIENNFDKYVELVCRNKLPIRTELPLNKNLIYERFLFYRIVFSEKKSGFKDFVAGRFRKFYGVSMPDKLYDNIISEMEKYGLLEISGDIIRCTPRLWSYIDNAVILY